MEVRILKALVLLTVCVGFASGQEDILETYPPGTVTSMTSAFTATTKSKSDQVFVTESYKVRTRVTYKGSSRKLSDKKRAFLAKWLKENEYPAAMLPKEEYLFADADGSHWLVLQSIVAPHLVEEIKPDGFVDLYMILLGSVKEDSNRSYVILINEFKRPEDERPSGTRTGKPVGWDTGEALNGYERYVPRTLREIIISHSDPKTLDKANMLMTGDTFPSRVKVTYSGSARKVLPPKKLHLDMLTEAFKVDPKVISRYETEMLFLEGTEEHWLPVQKDLIPFFEKELTKGEEVVLYAEWVGAKKTDDKWDWIFLVNEFQKLKKRTITAEPKDE